MYPSYSNTLTHAFGDSFKKIGHNFQTNRKNDPVRHSLKSGPLSKLIRGGKITGIRIVDDTLRLLADPELIALTATVAGIDSELDNVERVATDVSDIVKRGGDLDTAGEQFKQQIKDRKKQVDNLKPEPSSRPPPPTPAQEEQGASVDEYINRLEKERKEGVHAVDRPNHIGSGGSRVPQEATNLDVYNEYLSQISASKDIAQFKKDNPDLVKRAMENRDAYYSEKSFQKPSSYDSKFQKSKQTGLR